MSEILMGEILMGEQSSCVPKITLHKHFDQLRMLKYCCTCKKIHDKLQKTKKSQNSGYIYSSFYVNKGFMNTLDDINNRVLYGILPTESSKTEHTHKRKLTEFDQIEPKTNELISSDSKKISIDDNHLINFLELQENLKKYQSILEMRSAINLKLTILLISNLKKPEC